MTAGSRAGELKDQGNVLFKNGDFLRSASMYTKALKETQDSHEVSVLYSNRSAALLKLQKVQKALADAEDSIKADPSYHKAYMRKAVVLESQAKTQEALQCYQQALESCPGNNDYMLKIRSLTKALNSSSRAAAKVAKQQTKTPSELAALSFAEGKLQYALELAQEHGETFAPELHFARLGSSSKADEETAVRAAHAFDAPELLVQFTGEMRHKAEQLGATAAVLIAPTSAVAFPQTWQQEAWPFRHHHGIFVQLQAMLEPFPPGQPPSTGTSGSGSIKHNASAPAAKVLLQRCWFIRLRDQRPPLEPQEISSDFNLLQPLLR
eukprot:gene4480-4734_t